MPLQLHIDNIIERLSRAAQLIIQNRHTALTRGTYPLMRLSPIQSIQTLRGRTDKFDLQLHQSLKVYMARMKDRIAHLIAMLEILNPKTLLQKGYSITRSIPQHAVITSVDNVSKRQSLEVLLARGRLHVKIENKFTPSED